MILAIIQETTKSLRMEFLCEHKKNIHGIHVSACRFYTKATYKKIGKNLNINVSHVINGNNEQMDPQQIMHVFTALDFE